jgi:hypothetical protein
VKLNRNEGNWEKSTGRKAHRCFACGKRTDKLQGGHVICVEQVGVKLDYPKIKDEVYIMPLCVKCNNPSHHWFRRIGVEGNLVKVVQ